MTDEEKAFFEQMLKQVNDKMADLLDTLTTTRDDITNTKGHVVYVMEDSLTLGRRISKLEDEMRQRRGEGRS
jgi:hypothetical protein